MQYTAVEAGAVTLSGSISATTLTVTSTTGNLYAGAALTGGGLAPGTRIVQQTGGATPGGAGTYSVSVSNTALTLTGVTATNSALLLRVDPVAVASGSQTVNAWATVWALNANSRVVATYSTVPISTITAAGYFFVIPVRSTEGFDPSGSVYLIAGGGGIEAAGHPAIVAGAAGVTSIGDGSVNMPGPSGSAWINFAPATAHLSALGGALTGAAQHSLEVLRTGVLAQTPAYNAIGGAQTINCSLNGVQHIVLSGSPTLTLDALLPGQTCLVDIEEDGTGGRTPAWRTSARYTLAWDGGGAQPVQGTTASTHYLWRFSAQDSNIVVGALDGNCGTQCFGLPRPYYRSGQYVGVPPVAALGTSSGFSNNMVRVAAFTVSGNITITAADVEVTAAGDAGSTVRLCLFADNGTGYPGAKVSGGDFGTVSASTTGMKEISGLSVALAPGQYWIGTLTQYTTALALRTALVSTFAGGTGPPGTGDLYTGYLYSGPASGCPNNFITTVTPSQLQARMFIKVQ